MAQGTKSRPLRIAMFTGTFPAISETFIQRQITGLIDLGHEVEIFSDTRPDAGPLLHADVKRYGVLERTVYMDMPPETAPWEMPVWPITAQTWPPGAEKPVSNAARVKRSLPDIAIAFRHAPKLTAKAMLHSEYSYRAASLSAVCRLARLAGVTKEFDVLHAHFGPVGESFRFARELWGAPLVVSFHGYDFTTIPRKEGSSVYTKLFATADAVTANSRFTNRRLVELGCPAKKLHRLPTGLDPGQFRFRERTIGSGELARILSIARLVPIKGLAYALEAVARVGAKHRKVHFDIVGDGPLRGELEKLAVRLGIADSVRFHGALTQGQVCELMDAAHIFLHTSVTTDGDAEGQGLVLLEAQAAGLPVIATRHGAFPEALLDGESGYLVPERDVEAVAERLNFLIENPPLWHSMGRKGRAFVEKHFNIRDLNRALEELYHDVIGSFRHE
ncbi:MAG: glycosyltransferase [Verrucomicrobia subdivision 3 bacterium]|nr:glycosyltransferase [Limisphaerales bacterium]